MSGVLKTSAGAMNSGQEALERSAKEIESARNDLHSAYGRLQKQWQSSEARGRADAEYKKVIEWLDSSLRWARDGAVTTSEVNDSFGRVERAGLA
jgi:predicted acylesterase/phospholipase RssA